MEGWREERKTKGRKRKKIKQADRRAQFSKSKAQEIGFQ